MFGHLSFGQLMTLWYKGEIDTYLPPKELQTCPVFLLFFYFFVIFFFTFLLLLQNRLFTNTLLTLHTNTKNKQKIYIYIYTNTIISTLNSKTH